jgi:hypothetical protein
MPEVEADWIPYAELEHRLANLLEPHELIDDGAESDNDANDVQQDHDVQEPQHVRNGDGGVVHHDAEGGGRQPSQKKKRKSPGVVFDFEWAYYQSPSKKRAQRVATAAYPFRFSCVAPCSCSSPQFYQFRHHIKSHEGLDAQQHLNHEACRLLMTYHANIGALNVFFFNLRVYTYSNSPHLIDTMPQTMRPHVNEQDIGDVDGPAAAQQGEVGGLHNRPAPCQCQFCQKQEYAGIPHGTSPTLWMFLVAL